MADTTSSHGLPYPESTDSPDGAGQIQNLAEAVDTELDDIAPGQITGLTEGQMIVADSGGVSTARTIGGDFTIDGAGDATIANGAVTEAKLASDSVTSAKLGPGAVDSTALGSGAVTSGKIGAGAIVNADVSASAAIAESKLNLASDAAAGTASRRTLGTGSTQACAGNDSRLSDSRAPTGAAGGDLTGTYPNPTIGANKVKTSQLYLQTYFANGSVSSGGTYYAVQQSNIAPGTYICILNISKINSTGGKSGLEVGSGSATINQLVQQTDSAEMTCLSALVVVTSTASIRFKDSGGSGTVYSTLLLFGVRS